MRAAPNVSRVPPELLPLPQWVGRQLLYRAIHWILERGA